MVFISLTSAYIVRQGLPTIDGASNTYVRDWGRVDLPWLLLAINTAVLLVSTVTMELARRKAALQAALAPVKSIPGISVGDEKSFPWLGITVLLGQRRTARVRRVGRDDIGAVDLAWPVIAFDADDLVRPVGAVEHRDRTGEPVPAQMFFPKLAEPDPRLAHKAAAGKVDP